MRITRIVTSRRRCPARSAPAPSASPRTSPGTGGILNWFDYGDPGRLDVHAESPLVVQQATAGIYSGLLHYDPDDPTKVAADLAERWTVSAGRQDLHVPSPQGREVARRPAVHLRPT